MSVCTYVRTTIHFWLSCHRPFYFASLLPPIHNVLLVACIRSHSFGCNFMDVTPSVSAQCVPHCTGMVCMCMSVPCAYQVAMEMKCDCWEAHFFYYCFPKFGRLRLFLGTLHKCTYLSMPNLTYSCNIVYVCLENLIHAYITTENWGQKKVICIVLPALQGAIERKSGKNTREIKEYCSVSGFIKMHKFNFAKIRSQISFLHAPEL